MNDRELLEFAAKALGLSAYSYESNETYSDCYCNIRAWNPLDFDEDALRLAVELGIKVTPYPIFSDEKHSVIASRTRLAPAEDDENTYVGPKIIELYGDDPYAATRRAIVRAAAEIGKAKQ